MTIKGKWIISVLVITLNSCLSSKVTTITAYSPTKQDELITNLVPPTIAPVSQRSTTATSEKTSFGKRSDGRGNVIFTDDYSFSSLPSEKNGNKRKKHLQEEQKKTEYNSQLFTGGHLQNHRLEEGNLSPSTDLSSVAAAAVSSDFYSTPNDLHLSTDNSQLHNVHQSNPLGGGSANLVEGIASNGRSFLPQHYQNTYSHHGNGWASNSGACLFSCSSGSIGSGISCCQLNYVQCCPNPHQETFNFKNLHHGRGHIGGHIGQLGKSGYAWGPRPVPVPYNPPPIIRKPCHPQPLHQGLLSHQFSYGADHVGAGLGLGSGGNGAAGYYFHRRSDNDGNMIALNESPSSKKKRVTRSLHKHFDNNIQPCPVYSGSPEYGWSRKPPSVGLGSLIGWTKPTNYIQHGIYGGGGGYNSLYANGISGGAGHGWGWGNNFAGRGIHQCKWDYECPGVQKCCKGVCQFSQYV